MEAAVFWMNIIKAILHTHLRAEHLQRRLWEAYPIKELIPPSLSQWDKLATPTHMGIQHAPDRTDMEHLSSAPYNMCRHMGYRDAGGTMEGSGVHNLY